MLAYTNKYRLKLLIFILNFGFEFLFLVHDARAVEPLPAKFTVYAYLPWKKPAQDLAEYGIQPITVIYENKYLSYGQIDPLKIQNIASESALTPTVPVSFDMEFGDRFKPETVVPQAQAILKLYRNYNTKNPIGLYATLPQNTYGKSNAAFSYDKLNKKYRDLSTIVNYVSPSLYNYQKYDFTAWFENARFNIQMAKKHAPFKPIIPYISPIYRLGPIHNITAGNLVEELSEQEMSDRLNALYNLGASGCIIWASSQDRKEDGALPQFNPDRGWGKAVVEFIKSH